MSSLGYMLFKQRPKRLWRWLAYYMVTFLLTFVTLLHVLDVPVRWPWLDWWRQVPVIVVEESHEVIPYWFNASYVPQHRGYKYTVVHIDAFPDEGLPVNFEGYPIFQPPTSLQDVQSMMQSHFTYLQTTVMSGLVNRVLWVWPSWDQRNHNASYVPVYIELGWTHAKRPSATNIYDSAFYHHRLVFCECRSKWPSHNKTCYLLDIISRPERPQLRINSSDCTIAVRYLAEYIQDEAFIARLKQGRMFRNQELVLLNVDHSFFGVSSPMRVLRKNGVSHSVIRKLSDSVRLFLCPSTPQEEILADSYMQQGVRLFQEMCVIPELCNSSSIDRYSLSKLQKFAVNYMNRENSIFCQNDDPSVKQQWKSILHLLTTMTPKSISAILDVGFCLRTSPQTLGFDQEEEFQLCTGEPLETVNDRDIMEILESGQMKSQLKVFKDILSAGWFPIPQMASISRSVRNGLTQSLVTSFLEFNIMDMLNRTLIHSRMDTKFDQNLLGGRRGWYSRHSNERTGS